MQDPVPGHAMCLARTRVLRARVWLGPGSWTSMLVSRQHGMVFEFDGDVAMAQRIGAALHLAGQFSSGFQIAWDVARGGNENHSPVAQRSQFQIGGYEPYGYGIKKIAIKYLDAPRLVRN